MVPFHDSTLTRRVQVRVTLIPWIGYWSSYLWFTAQRFHDEYNWKYRRKRKIEEKKKNRLSDENFWEDWKEKSRRKVIRWRKGREWSGREKVETRWEKIFPLDNEDRGDFSSLKRKSQQFLFFPLFFLYFLLSSWYFFTLTFFPGTFFLQTGSIEGSSKRKIGRIFKLKCNDGRRKRKRRRKSELLCQKRTGFSQTVGEDERKCCKEKENEVGKYALSKIVEKKLNEREFLGRSWFCSLGRLRIFKCILTHKVLEELLLHFRFELWSNLLGRRKLEQSE